MTITGLDSATSVSLIGHLGMGLLCASLAGVFARFGAGGAMLVSLVLSAGLFAKMFDSGYPTVLSQLGFILGLLVVLKNKKRSPNKILAILSVAFAGVIHPSGAMYLILLILGRILVKANLNEEDTERNNVIVGSSLLIGVSLLLPEFLLLECKMMLFLLNTGGKED